MKNGRKTTLEIIDNLRRVFQAINEYSRNAEQLTGLTGPQLWVLKILYATSPLMVSELAQSMYLRPPTVVRILDRLELKGLISRVRSTEDRRVVHLHLTEAGKLIAAKSPEVAQAMLLQGLDELSDEQYACVEEGMKLMAKLLGAEHMIPQPLHS